MSFLSEIRSNCCCHAIAMPNVASVFHTEPSIELVKSGPCEAV